MLRLKTLGLPLVERRDGKSLSAAARQRRVLALLAIVATGRDRGVSRDRILALLWSESEPEKARQALTQALYHARRALEQDDVFVASADLRLNPDVISADVAEFEQALDDGDYERAVSLYEGPFLDGFYVNGAPEFERWASEYQARLKDRYARALEHLAETNAAAGDHRGAVEWRRRLAALEPLNSRYALELMRSMAIAGDRAGAIRFAQVHEALMRQELGASPNPAIVELATRLRDTPLWTPNPLPATRRGDAERNGDDIPPSPDVPNEATGPAAAGRDVPSTALDADVPATAPTPARRRFTVPAWIAAGVVVLVAASLLVWRSRSNERVSQAAPLIVVMPFRVTGADPSLAYLKEGLVDLLFAKLIGDSDEQAADPGTVLSALRRAGLSDRTDVPHDEAVRVARQLGGSRLLLGSVVGSRANLVVNATLLGLPNGDLRAQASSGGPVDSLTMIVDRLVARLLAKEAGEWERLASRTSTSVQALRAFLDGQAAYRRGSYREAIRAFKIALDRDASFAMAGLALATAADRIDAFDDRARGLAAAWAARDELTARDSLYLHALAGPRYPAPSSNREQLNAWERAVSAATDRADVWHELGERLFYDGRLLGLRNWQSRATAAFERAVQLDPTFASPLQYLVQLAAADGDTATVRHAATAYLKLDSTGDLADFVKWRAAVALADSATIHRLRRTMGSMPAASLRTIILSSQYGGFNLEDARRALDALSSRAARASDRTDVILANHALALNRGSADDALEATEQLAEDRSRLRMALRLRVLDRLYASGDSIAAAAAVARLTSSTTSDAPAEDACVVDQWRAWALPTAPMGKPAARPAQNDPALTNSGPCVALRDAIEAVRSRTATAPVLVAQFDSVMQAEDLGPDMPHYAGLALARLYDELGETSHALTAVRKRPQMRPWPRYLASQLYLEGRLATAADDTVSALDAYQHFLALRGASRASAEVAAARAQIQRLKSSDARNPRE